MVIKALEENKRGLFADIDLLGDNEGKYLKAELAARFGVENIPDGFFYFPIDLGGLGMRNPIIPLSLVCEEALTDPMVEFDEAFEVEDASYHKVKQS